MTTQPHPWTVTQVDVYPVGILRDLLLSLHVIRHGRPGTRARCHRESERSRRAAS